MINNKIISILEKPEDKSQPKLSIVRIIFNNLQIIEAEVAIEHHQQLMGLQYRDHITPMLFIHDKDETICMHTDNIKEPIDIIFINEFFSIVEVFENVPIGADGICCDKVKYVLELPASFCINNYIKVGGFIEILNP